MPNSSHLKVDAIEACEQARNLISLLQEQAQPLISMETRQRAELARFLEAHRQEVLRRASAIESETEDKPSDLNTIILTTRRMELDEATRFLNRCFVIPRSSGQETQILEAADWLCVECFIKFVGDPGSSGPIGPIVAIDASTSPAVWSASQPLPMPSMFQKRLVNRGSEARYLPIFPVVCLPGYLARSPEYLPLLSHEVGHVIDDHCGLAELILSVTEDFQLHDYWRAWMREIVADAIGIALSGSAYAVALRNYLSQNTPFTEVTASKNYPPDQLRLEFCERIVSLLENQTDGSAAVPRLDHGHEIIRNLFVDFSREIMPHLKQHILDKNTNWLEESRAIESLAQEMSEKGTIEVANLRSAKISFRSLPSIVTIAKEKSVGKNHIGWDSLRAFRSLHSDFASLSKPEWIAGDVQWRFTEEHLPALRPTHLSADGRFKVPPLFLMTTHHKIAFVGATNWQLHEKLKAAFALRQESGLGRWTEMHFFFANDDVLKHVEYGKLKRLVNDGEMEVSKEVTPNDARAIAWEEIRKSLMHDDWADNWSMQEFDGTPIFGSYWDWDQRGGRIHISAALKGTEIGRCPATDIVWIEEVPSEHYTMYLTHLEHLMKRALGRVEGCKR